MGRNKDIHTERLTTASWDPADTEFDPIFPEVTELNVGPFTGQFDNYEDQYLRDKYPALKQAWEHYQMVKQMCKTKESEDA